MPITNISILTDSEIKTKAQEVFAALGLDMTTAVNLFLRQTVRMNDLPFVMTTGENQLEKPFKLLHSRGCMKGKMWMADDFDAPMEDFREYME